MIIIIALFIIGVVITSAFWKHSSRADGIASAIVCSVIFCIIVAIVCGSSYDTYLNDRSFYSATKEQYHSAIKVYADYAVIDMGKAAFTDLKYQGYQENIGSFIKNLRNRIIKYNTSIVEKRIIGKNPIFSWFIIEPDEDMVIIKMKSELSD